MVQMAKLSIMPFDFVYCLRKLGLHLIVILVILVSSVLAIRIYLDIILVFVSPVHFPIVLFVMTCAMLNVISIQTKEIFFLS